MRRHEKTLIVAVIIIVAASLAYLAVRHNREVGLQSTALPDQSYANTSYGFQFKYPPQYRLNEYTGEYIELQDPQTGAGLVDVTVDKADDVMPYATFADFAHARGEATCAADGPTGSARCPAVSRSETFVGAAGSAGEVFYLTYELVHNGAATTTREMGPFYAFNISANNPERPYTALIVRPAYGAEESARNDASVALAHSVADSLVLNAPAN